MERDDAAVWLRLARWPGRQPLHAGRGSRAAGRAFARGWSSGRVRPAGQVARTQAPSRQPRPLAEEVAQVQRGGAAFEPGAVLGHAAIAELEPASPPGG